MEYGFDDVGGAVAFGVSRTILSIDVFAVTEVKDNDQQFFPYNAVDDAISGKAEFPVAFQFSG